MKPLLVFACAIWLAACSASVEKSGPAPRLRSEIFDGLTADAVWKMPGLKDRVEIARDQYGVPHFYAHNLHDLMLVQGYVVARDRFWEMDIFRRLALGKVSTLVGLAPVLIDFDELFRAINLTERGTMVYDEIYEQMDSKGKSWLDAYAMGVNLYLDHAATGKYGAKAPPEYNELLLGMLFHPSVADLPRWEPRDSIAIGRLQQWMLSGSDIERDLLIGKMQGAMKAAHPDWLPALIHFRPAVTQATIDGWPGVQPGYAPASEDGVLNTFRNMREAFPLLLWGDNGSNNWVVGPSKSASGHVLVANDPHLIMTNPPLFYQAHMNTAEQKGEEAWNAYGVVFPGIPVLMIGHTDRIAWGVTVLGYDVLDVYKETLTADGKSVLRGAQTVPIKHSNQVYCHGYSDECVTRPLAYVPGHGPRAPHSDQDGDFYTFRYTGAEPTQDFKAFAELMKAQNVSEALKAIGLFRVGSQNFVVGDVDGHIAYIGSGNVPVRDSQCPQPPYVPLDGASGKCEWQGYLPDSEIPMEVDPAKGYLATANNDIVGTSFDNDLTNDTQYYWESRDMGFRIKRLTDLLEEKDKFDVSDMERIAADVYSVEGSLIAPRLVQAGDAATGLGITVSPAAREALEYLRKWGYYARTGVKDPFTNHMPSDVEIEDSVATSIYYTWTRYLKDVFTDDEYAAFGLSRPAEDDGYDPLGMARTILYSYEFDNSANLWDDRRTPAVETREEVMLGALEEAVVWLADRFESSTTRDWRWGVVHYIRFFDIYGILGANVRAIGPYPSDGALGTLDAATPLFLQNSYVQLGGAQMRMVTELDPAGVQSWNSLPGGQVLDRESNHYDDLVKYFMTNTTFKVPFQKNDVESNLESLTIALP